MQVGAKRNNGTLNMHGMLTQTQLEFPLRLGRWYRMQGKREWKARERARGEGRAGEGKVKEEDGEGDKRRGGGRGREEKGGGEVEAKRERKRNEKKKCKKHEKGRERRGEEERGGKGVGEGANGIEWKGKGYRNERGSGGVGRRARQHPRVVSASEGGGRQDPLPDAPHGESHDSRAPKAFEKQ